MHNANRISSRMADWNLAPGLAHQGPRKQACAVSWTAAVSSGRRQGQTGQNPEQEKLGPWDLCLSYLHFSLLCPSWVFRKGLLKVPVYFRCRSEGVFKNKLGHRTWRVAIMVVGMEEENPEGRGRGKQMEASCGQPSSLAPASAAKPREFWLALQFVGRTPVRPVCSVEELGNGSDNGQAISNHNYL